MVILTWAIDASPVQRHSSPHAASSRSEREQVRQRSSRDLSIPRHTDSDSSTSGKSEFSSSAHFHWSDGMDRLLLTAEEVAEVLNVGRCKVYDLIRNGEIESIKIGRLRRIPVDNVRKFADRLIEEGRA